MSEYKDAKNNTYKIVEQSIVSGEEHARVQDEIIEELYNIFTRK